MARKKAKPADAKENKLKSFLKQREDEHYNFESDVFYKVSTGSLLLDIHTGGGLTPGLHRFCGMNEGGKTSEALEVARNFLKDIPNARAVYIKAEGRLNPEMVNRSGIAFTNDPDEWGDGKCFIYESEKYVV